MNNDEIKETLSDIKKELKGISKVLVEYKVLEQKIISSNAKHDEGRKVLHKRLDTSEQRYSEELKVLQKKIDVFSKIIFWFGTTIFTSMAGIIWTLINKVLGN